MKARILLAHRARRVFFFVHLWLGLIVGAWFSLIGLTGSVLAWRGELSGMELSRRFPIQRPANNPPMISLSQAIASMESAHPDASPREMATVTVPNSKMPFYSFTRGRGRANSRTILIDPYTAQVHPPVAMRTLTVGTIQQFHQRLIAGAKGYLVNGFLNFLAIPLVLSGLWLWWPTKLKHLKTHLTLKRGVSLKRTLYDLHNIMGIYLYVVLLVTTVTGAMLVQQHVAADGGIAAFLAEDQPAPRSVGKGGEGKGGEGREGGRGEGRSERRRAEGQSPNEKGGESRGGESRGGESRGGESRGGGSRGSEGRGMENRGEARGGGQGSGGQRGEEELPTVVPQDKRLSDDEVLAAARSLRPQYEVTRIRRAQRPDQPYQITYARATGLVLTENVLLNPYTGQALDVAPPSPQTPLRQMTRAFHFGEFGGVVSKLLYTLTGFMPAGLFVTGFLLWWRKKRKRSARVAA